MRLRLFIGALVLGAHCAARAGLYTVSWDSGFANGGVIPDGDASGWTDTRMLSGITPTVIADVNVTVNLSGGYNGDLYAYLTHGSGFTVLLNRVGKDGLYSSGYDDTGFRVVLDDQAAEAVDIHRYQTTSYSLNDSGQLQGTWRPDGRPGDPTMVAFDSPRDAVLDSFNGLNPNGAWTLFFADLAGQGQSTLTGWSLELTAVPEQVNTALAVFGAVLGAGGLWRAWARRRREG